MVYKLILDEKDIHNMLEKAFDSDGKIEFFWKVEEEENGIMGPTKSLVITLVSDEPITQDFYF